MWIVINVTQSWTKKLEKYNILCYTIVVDRGVTKGEIIMAKTDERFVKTYSQGTINIIEIWVDKETGVNYIYREAGYSGGLTVLLDSDGKPVISRL